MRARLAALACGVLLAGCGQSDEDEVRTAAQDFTRAFAAKDYGRACDLMSGRAKQQLQVASAFLGRGKNVGNRCEDQMGLLSGFASPDVQRRLESYEVKTVRIDGDHATITDNITAGPTALVHEDDRWVVDFGSGQGGGQAAPGAPPPGG